MNVTITTAQMRGARGLLNWNQSELSKRTGISTTSIGNIEAGNTQARESTLKVIKQAFENAGIEFIGTEGMRLRNDFIKTFQGKDQFWDFYEDVYSTLRENPGEVLVSNVDERLFVSNLDETQVNKHIRRMNELNNVSYRLLVKEDESFFIDSMKYKYKGIPQNAFSPTPFYIYANKFALIQFEPEVNVIVIQNASIANAYRLQFETMWDNASKFNRKEAV